MPDAGQGPSVYGSRPVLTVNGQLQTLLGDRLLGLCVEEHVDGLYQAELTIANFDRVNDGFGFVYFDRSLLDFGKPITIQLGAGTAAETVFAGTITALEGRFPHVRPPEILIKAEDRL